MTDLNGEPEIESFHNIDFHTVKSYQDLINHEGLNTKYKMEYDFPKRSDMVYKGVIYSFDNGRIMITDVSQTASIAEAGVPQQLGVFCSMYTEIISQIGERTVNSGFIWRTDTDNGLISVLKAIKGGLAIQAGNVLKLKRTLDDKGTYLYIPKAGASTVNNTTKMLARDEEGQLNHSEGLILRYYNEGVNPFEMAYSELANLNLTRK